MQSARKYIENDHGLEVFTISNFLTDSECNILCDLIKINHKKSVVVGDKSLVYDESRTSSTSYLNSRDSIVANIDKKISDELGVPLTHAEPTQGQLYEEGQQFKHHNDFFWGSAVNNYCLSSGQRKYTFMVYLNDVEEGGETDFYYLNTKITPTKGTALVWKNAERLGQENTASLHAGLPVIKGEKMVITKWFRENEYNSTLDSKLALEYHTKNATR